MQSIQLMRQRVASARTTAAQQLVPGVGWSLELEYMPIDDQLLTDLVAVVAEPSVDEYQYPLTSLEVREGELAGRSCAALCRALISVPAFAALGCLSLCENPKFGDNGAKALAMYIRPHSSAAASGSAFAPFSNAHHLPLPALHTLRLASNKIGCDGTAAIAAALGERNLFARSSSAELGGGGGDGGSGSIGDSTGASHLAAASLIELSLYGNRIADTGALAIAAMLGTCGGIQSVLLGNNCIGDVGAIALADLLFTDASIGCLDLAYNCIGRRGVDAFCAAISYDGGHASSHWMQPPVVPPPELAVAGDHMDDGVGVNAQSAEVLEMQLQLCAPLRSILSLDLTAPADAATLAPARHDDAYDALLRIALERNCSIRRLIGVRGVPLRRAVVPHNHVDDNFDEGNDDQPVHAPHVVALSTRDAWMQTNEYRALSEHARWVRRRAWFAVRRRVDVVSEATLVASHASAWSASGTHTAAAAAASTITSAAAGKDDNVPPPPQQPMLVRAPSDQCRVCAHTVRADEATRLCVDCAMRCIMDAARVPMQVFHAIAQYL